jgi:hypothetical protein
MIEETVAEYIASNTTHSTGTDLFLQYFVNEVDEGIVVVGRTIFAEHTPMWATIIRILVAYFDYITTRTKTYELINLFNNKRGTVDGTWTISGPIETEDLGKDENNRFVFCIEIKVNYDYDTL